jgi:hypothetical protein
MTMLAWERTDQRHGLSIARREPLADGWLFHGSEILVGTEVGQETVSCTFRVVVGPNWTSRQVEVLSVSGAGEVRRVLEASEDGWMVDGAPRRDLEGCVDVDIAASPLTNTFPIRRLADLDVGDSVTFPVAWVDVPALGVARVDQTYERLPDRDGMACWKYRDPAHGAFVLTVDDEGLVLDYEGFARRIRTVSG